MSEKFLEDSLLELILNTSRQIKGEMSFDAGSNHITLHQLQVLLFIVKHKQVRMVDLASYLNITMPSTTNLVDKLVKERLIKRAGSKEDRRSVNLTLAKKAEDLVNQAMKQKARRLKQILGYISDADKRDLLRIMTRISERIQSEKA